MKLSTMTIVAEKYHLARTASTTSPKTYTPPTPYPFSNSGPSQVLKFTGHGPRTACGTGSPARISYRNGPLEPWKYVRGSALRHWCSERLELNLAVNFDSAFSHCCSHDERTDLYSSSSPNSEYVELRYE